jgi:phosphatidylethanolamine-binding protein (PEBP) family uncharacterized protein
MSNYIFSMNWIGPFCAVTRHDRSRIFNADLVTDTVAAFESRPIPLLITSPAFPEGGFLPLPYRSVGCNCNPPLQIVGIPSSARSLLVILEQPGAPLAPRTHWLCWDLPTNSHIQTRAQNGTQGRNDFLHEGYTGPFLQKEIFRFTFLVYALRYQLHLPPGASRYQVEKHIASAQLACGGLSCFA